MRSGQTDAESALWLLLRSRRLAGWKFRRQVPIEGFVADFACFAARLIVEADGGQHSENPRDAERDDRLRAAGFEVVRYWNNDILNNPDGVLADLTRRLKTPSPLAGEGGRSEAEVG